MACEAIRAPGPPERRSGEVIDALTAPAIDALAGREPIFHADRGWLWDGATSVRGKVAAPHNLAMLTRSIDARCPHDDANFLLQHLLCKPRQHPGFIA